MMVRNNTRRRLLPAAMQLAGLAAIAQITACFAPVNLIAGSQPAAGLTVGAPADTGATINGSAADTLRTRELSSPAPVWTLDSILARIRAHNPVLQGYDYRADALEAYAEGAGSWMPPMLGAGSFMTPYPGQKLMGEGNKGMFMIAAEQAIPHPAKIKARKNYMNSRAATETAGREYTFNQLRAEAKSLYYQWLVMERKMAVLEESRGIMQTVLKLAEIRYPYNQGSLAGIYKAQGRLHELENRILAITNEIAGKHIRLNSLMNSAPGTRFRVDTGANIIRAGLMIPDSGQLLAERSDLEQLEHSIETMQLGIEMEQAERKPGFSIRLEHMQPYGGTMPGQYTVMGMISIPIAPWSAKKYKAEVKGMQLDIRSMEKEREALLRNARGIISGLARDMQTARQQLKNYDEKILPALGKNYEATFLAYQQNQGELQAVTDAWEALNMAKMEYLDKQEEYYLMIVQYEKELEK